MQGIRWHSMICQVAIDHNSSSCDMIADERGSGKCIGSISYDDDDKEIEQELLEKFEEAFGEAD